MTTRRQFEMLKKTKTAMGENNCLPEKDADFFFITKLIRELLPCQLGLSVGFLGI